MNFIPALCQDCSKDGNAYFAAVNKHPLNTTFRCPICIHLHGKLIERDKPDVEDKVVRGFFLPLMAAMMIGIIILMIIAIKANADEIDEYYQSAMRKYRYGNVTNEVRASIHYEYCTNVIQHGQLKRELVYTLEVLQIEGRTNKYVLSDDFINDRIIIK
jgi:hypothetical protein